MHRFCCILIVFTVLLSLIAITYISVTKCAPSNESLYVPYSANAPTIDGKWTTSTEWTDASEYKLSNQNGWTAYIRLKQNSTYFFILADFVSDQTGTDSISQYDYCGIFLDTLDDGGNYAKLDDFLLSQNYYSNYTSNGMNTYLSQGTGSSTNSWAEISVLPGFSLVRGFSSINDPYQNSTNHRIYEASIPLAFLGNRTEIGFYLFLRDANSGVLLQFPENAGGSSDRSDSMADSIAPAPSNWGNCIFVNSLPTSPTPSTPQSPITSPIAGKTSMYLIPESTVIIVIIILAIAIVLLIGIRKPKSYQHTI